MRVRSFITQKDMPSGQSRLTCLLFAFYTGMVLLSLLSIVESIFV